MQRPSKKDNIRAKITQTPHEQRPSKKDDRRARITKTPHGQRPSKKYGRTAGTTHTQWNQLASFKKDVITAGKTHTPWNPASFKKNDSTLSTVQQGQNTTHGDQRPLGRPTTQVQNSGKSTCKYYTVANCIHYVGF